MDLKQFNEILKNCVYTPSSEKNRLIMERTQYHVVKVLRYADTVKGERYVIDLEDTTIALPSRASDAIEKNFPFLCYLLDRIQLGHLFVELVSIGEGKSEIKFSAIDWKRKNTAL